MTAKVFWVWICLLSLTSAPGAWAAPTTQRKASTKKAKKLGKAALTNARVQQDLAAFDRVVASKQKAFAKVPAKPQNVAWVKQKLAHMVDVDQTMRKFTRTPGKRKYSPQETKFFWKHFHKRWQAIDKGNTLALQQLRKLHMPWFTIGKFGKAANKNAWLLVQHADQNRPFQKQILKVLKPLVKQGQTSAKHYAYLQDRVTTFGDRLPQRFGTQGRCVGPGKWEPFPIADAHDVDKRRKAVGLATMAVYKKRFLTMCGKQRPSRKWSKTALAKAFFHYHQAAGHLESWAVMKRLKKPRCHKSLQRAKEHLAKIPKAATSNFQHPFFFLGYYLRGALHNAQAKGAKINVIQIEEVRMRVHDFIRKLGMKHPDKWHQAFRACRTKKPNL